MNQKLTDLEDVARQKAEGSYEAGLETCLTSYNGFLRVGLCEKNTFDDSPEERKSLYEDLLIKQGGFNFINNNYLDIILNEQANRAVSHTLFKSLNPIYEPSSCHRNSLKTSCLGL